MSIFSKSNTNSESNFIKKIIPGEKVKGKIKSISFGEDRNGDKTEDINIIFKGTDPENNGEHKEIFWANTFDPKDDRYDPTWAERHWARFVQIVTVLITEDEFFGLFDGDNDDFSTISRKVIKYLDGIKGDNETFDKECVAKITYNTKKWFTQFPLFPNFISSDLTPTRGWDTDPMYDVYVKPEEPSAPAPAGNIESIDPTEDATENTGGSDNEDIPF